MTRRGAPLLLWLLATAAAVVVASAAIAQVGREVTRDTAIDQRLAQATADPPTGTTPAEQQPPATESAPTTAAVRTYDTVGGSAAVVVDGDTVDVRWATPNDGFRVSTERSPAGDELRVEFRSDAHRSRIDVELEAGEVKDSVDEDDRR